MFLRQLSNKQKELTLGLAVLAAKANSVIEKDEEYCLRLYAEEMGIDVNNASPLPLKEICAELISISNEKEINQIVFEIIGLMFSDSEFDNDEKSFVRNVTTHLNVSKEKTDTMVECVKDYYAMLGRINAIMFDID